MKRHPLLGWLLLAPSLIVQPEHVEEAVKKLDRVLGWVETTAKGS